MTNFNFQQLLSNRVNRRRLLIGAGALTGLALATGGQRKVLAQPKFSSYPFTLGIASGEPYPDSVVLRG